MKENNIQKVTGTVFDIKKYAIHDGPGIRTTVFFKGCPLHCAWCANPESWDISPEIIYSEISCIKCFSCIKICPVSAINFEKSSNKIKVNKDVCTSCNKCIDECPTKALKLVGKHYSVGELISEIKDDESFYRESKGGITLSGGEPTMQYNFLLKFIKKCKENYLNIVLDTCGYISWSIMEEIIKYVDLVFYDIKIINSFKHKEYTGKSNEIILKNAQRISSLDIPMVIRFPLVPGYNDSEKDIKSLGMFASKLKSVKEIDILPYHRLGESKHVKLRGKYKLEGVQLPNNIMIQKVKKWLSSSSNNIRIKVGG